MEKLAEILNSFPSDAPLVRNADMLARKIRLLSQSGMAQLLMGNGTEKSIKLDNRLNILQIENIKLPEPGTKKDDYTQEETMSFILMMDMTAFCRKDVYSHKKEVKFLLVEESGMLGTTS